MRRFLSCSLRLGALLAVVTQLLCGQGSPSGRTVTIEVIDPAGTSVARAEVRFSPPPEDGPGKLQTATNGKLSLNLKPGSYTLVVLCPGFKTSSTHINVSDTEEVQTVSVRLQVGDTGSPRVEVALESPRNKCASSQFLKPTKTVNGTYTEEAAKANAEGTVVLCVTVDGHGNVADVGPISGPPELLQLSIDAARQWKFEPPPKAPASVAIEMRYSLTKPCPEGKGFDAGDIVMTIVPTDEKPGDLKIVGKLSQPWPPYPEAARVERRRGQLYLTIIVNPDGTVSDVRITKSFDELLDKPAVETVRTWRFKVSPGGRPTRFSVTLSFRIPCLDDL